MDEQIFEGLGKTRPFVLVLEIPPLIRVREANLAIELVRFVILRSKLLFLCSALSHTVLHLFSRKILIPECFRDGTTQI